MCCYVSLVMSLCSRDTSNGSSLTSLTSSKAPGFWMVEHQLVQVGINIRPAKHGDGWDGRGGRMINLHTDNLG